MLLALVLMFAAVLYRIALAMIGDLHGIGAWNFAPLAAIALCGGVFLPKRFAVAVPVAALLISDLVLNAFYGVPLFDLYVGVRAAALLLTAGVGMLLRGRGLAAIASGSLACSTMFYVVTNTAAWAAMPAYPSGFSGWLQALTVGLPGYPETWKFFVNTAASDLLFTILFVLCMKLPFRSADEPRAVVIPSTR